MWPAGCQGNITYCLQTGPGSLSLPLYFVLLLSIVHTHSLTVVSVCVPLLTAVQHTVLPLVMFCGLFHASHQEQSPIFQCHGSAVPSSSSNQRPVSCSQWKNTWTHKTACPSHTLSRLCLSFWVVTRKTGAGNFERDPILGMNRF